MKITVLGTSSGLSVVERHASAYLVQSGPAAILLEAGEGVTRQLLRFGIEPNDIQAVLLSHTHPDHASGIFSLLVHMHLRGRRSPLAIHVPQGVRRPFRDLFPVFQIFREKWSFPFHVDAIAPGRVHAGSSFDVLALPNAHLRGSEPFAEKSGIGSDSYSFRLTEGEKSVLYTADVPDLGHLHSAGARTDLLIAECTHIGIGEIAAFAETNRIPRLLLTHIPPEQEDALLPPIPEGTIAFAEEGTIIEV